MNHYEVEIDLGGTKAKVYTVNDYFHLRKLVAKTLGLGNKIKSIYLIGLMGNRIKVIPYLKNGRLRFEYEDKNLSKSYKDTGVSY